MTPPSVMESPVTAQANVEWGAVFAGAAIATAFGLILLAFGAAIGLSFISPYSRDDLLSPGFAVAAGLYLLWVQVMSFYFGGYVTARLRARAPALSEHEVDVRDGLHGLTVWAIGVVVAFILAYAGVGGLATAGHAQNQVTASIAQVADQQVNASTATEHARNPDAGNSTQAERRAEVARKFSIIAAFISSASLLLGAAAAFSGAHAGGHHRDKTVRWAFFNSRARVS